MSEIQVGTSTFDADDFLIAVQDVMTCGDCEHCQQNKKIPDRTMDWTCYHPENMQQAYYGEQGMQVNDNFLCNKFGLYT